MHVRCKSYVFYYNFCLERDIEKNKMFWISNILQDKFAFVILERKIKIRGATRSQSCTSVIVIYSLPLHRLHFLSLRTKKCRNDKINMLVTVKCPTTCPRNIPMCLARLTKEFIDDIKTSNYFHCLDKLKSPREQNNYKSFFS